MLKLSRFFQNIVKSCTSWKFYQELLKTPFNFSLKYFLLLIFLVSLVFSTQISIALVGITTFLSQKGQNELVKNFPSQLEFSLKNGKVQTTVPQPFFLPFSAIPNQRVPSNELGNIKNLLVIDTINPYSWYKFQSYSTLFWLTGSSLAYSEPRKNTTNILPLNDVPDFTINKQTVVAFFTNSILPFLHKFFPFLVIGIYVVSFVGYLWNTFVSVALLAIIVWLLTKVTKLNLSYSQSLQLTIHANTLPLLISTLLGLFFIRLPMPFWHSLLTLIILFYYLNKNPQLSAKQ